MMKRTLTTLTLLSINSLCADFKPKISSLIDTIHPYFSLENIDTLENGTLMVGGMCFDEDTLYVTTLIPDRLNKKPFHEGKVLRVNNVTKANGEEEKISADVVITGLYEPCSIATVGESIYVGTKTQVLRFDGATTATSAMTIDDAVVLIDGLSAENFHTYTIGFEKYIKDGQTYLCGNLTTAIKLGGKRDKMVPPNPKAFRGSTFTFGPVTGTEKPSEVELDFIAGGYRTPNGIEVGPDNEIIVLDNQGIFNPTNEFIRVEQGAFYGHYLYTQGGKAAAFQPKEINAINGGSIGQKPATVHIPQGIVGYSPAQAHVIRNQKGILAPYNGQTLVCEFTSGSILRVFTEKVENVWQGVVFKHSGGAPTDKEGNGGFTAGPNRIEQGPDGNYYIGQIGCGGLWHFNNGQSGLQRFRVKKEGEVDTSFNEILAVRVVDGGLEVEFLKPVDPTKVSTKDLSISQWTYIPTNKYGGGNVGTENLTAKSLSFDPTKRKATILIDGLKDGSKKYVIKQAKYTSDNSGWVVNVKFNKTNEEIAKLYVYEFWYTLHKKIGGKDLNKDQIVKPSPLELAQAKFQSLCISCHSPRGEVWAAPNLRKILGRKQIVVTSDGKEKEVTVDRDYIINAITNSQKERPIPFKDITMPGLGIKKLEAAALADYIISLE